MQHTLRLPTVRHSLRCTNPFNTTIKVGLITQMVVTAAARGGTTAMQQQCVCQHYMPGLGEPLPHLADCIYVDYNATTPIYPEVAAALQPFIYEAFGAGCGAHE